MPFNTVLGQEGGFGNTKAWLTARIINAPVASDTYSLLDYKSSHYLNERETGILAINIRRRAHVPSGVSH